MKRSTSRPERKTYRPYSNFERCNLRSPQFRALSRDARYLWLYLFLSPDQILPGILCLGRAALAESCDMPLKEFDKAIAELASAGLVLFDWESRLCFVPWALIGSPAKNPDQYKGWLLKVTHELRFSPIVTVVLDVLFAQAKKDEWKQTYRDCLAEWSRQSGPLRETPDPRSQIPDPRFPIPDPNLRSLTEIYVVPFPKAKKEPTSLVLSEVSDPKPKDPLSPSVQEAFEYWRKVMGKNTNTLLTPKRRRLIRDRLKEGYTLDDIKRAIDGCSQDAFNMGANDRSKPFNDIELICRSGEKLEGFRDALDAPGGVAKPWAMPHGMKEWADKVLTKELFPEANGGDSVFWDATKKGWYHFTKEPLPLGTFTKLELAHEEICARFDRYLAELNNPKGSVWRQN